MPNVEKMADRLESHKARVSGKMIEREFKRLDWLLADSKISRFTWRSLRHSVELRLAYIANRQ